MATTGTDPALARARAGSGLVQLATEADLPALAADFGPEGLFRDRLRRQAAGRGVLLTHRLDKDGPPEGVVYVWLEPAEEQEVRDHLPGVPLLMHLKVHHDLRGWGIGSALVKAAEEYVAACDLTHVALGVDPGNVNAKSLYRHLGYQEWAHGMVVTHQVEYRQRRRRRYNEICQMFVKQLTVQ